MGVEPKRVLIVDDDPDIRTLLTTALTLRGLSVDAAADGAQALRLIEANHYAVMVLDLFMPVTNGFAVLDALKKRDEPMLNPIVLVLTAADQHTINGLDARIIHGIVRKPFDPVDLANLVVACAEIRNRSAFETMAIAAMLAGPPLVAWLTKMS
jgi:DNA-binding response OmpR family regulator